MLNEFDENIRLAREFEKRLGKKFPERKYSVSEPRDSLPFIIGYDGRWSGQVYDLVVSRNESFERHDNDLKIPLFDLCHDEGIEVWSYQDGTPAVVRDRRWTRNLIYYGWDIQSNTSLMLQSYGWSCIGVNLPYDPRASIGSCSLFLDHVFEGSGFVVNENGKLFIPDRWKETKRELIPYRKGSHTQEAV